MAASITDAKVHIKWIPAEDVTQENVESYLADCDGVLVPGGFGSRGLEGKIDRRAVRPGKRRCPSWASAWACRWR